MSLMAVSKEAWAAIDRNPAAPRDSFLSILDWRDQWHGNGRFPYTPSVSDLHGVLAAAKNEAISPGNMSSDNAKIIGMTPAWLTRSGK